MLMFNELCNRVAYLTTLAHNTSPLVL